MFTIVVVVCAIGIQRHADNAIGVVAIDKILHDIRGLTWIRHTQFAKLSIQLAWLHFVGAIEDPLNSWLAEFVVHHGVERFSVKPRVGARPNFAGDVGVGIDPLYQRAPLMPERHGHFVGNIKPPSVNAVAWIAVSVGIHPALGDFKNMFARAFAGNAVLVIFAESWKFAIAKPTLVFKGLPTFYIEPIRVRTGLAILLNIHKCWMSRPHMIEHAVNYHMKSLLFSLFYKGEKLLVGVCPSPST